MSTGTRRLDLEEVGDVTVAKFTDKKILDEGNIQIIGNQLFALIEEDGRQKIVLDFSNVEYLSSAALGKLITMDKKVKAAKGKLRLCNIRADIYEVFAITKLNKLFDMKDNLEAALQGLEGNRHCSGADLAPTTADVPGNIWVEATAGKCGHSVFTVA